MSTEEQRFAGHVETGTGVNTKELIARTRRDALESRFRFEIDRQRKYGVSNESVLDVLRDIVTEQLDTTSKIAKWRAEHKPMEAVHCIRCGTLVSVYTLQGECLDCAT